MQSPFYKQNKINKVDISLKQLMDVDTTNELAYRRLDNIFPNQVLTSYTNPLRRDAFRFKYLTDLIIAGTGVTITNNAGILTIATSGGGTGTVTSIDVDGGTGISVSPAGPITTSGTFTVTNTAPDQTVVLNNGTGINVTGTYPNFTINATASGGGLKYGLATQASPGVYTTTITGVTSLTAGDVFLIKFDSENENGSTLNINSLGAIDIFKNTDVKIASGDIKTNQTIELVYDGANFQAIGLVSSQLLAYVHNAEGATITKGQIVYAYQASGDKMSVKLARADSDATSAKTIGLVYDSSIGIGGEGYIIIQGVIEGINTAAFSAGNTLYLSGSTYGAATNVKPYAPTHLVYVGIVERANAGNGQIYVRCQNGYELDEIHDVDLITTPPVNNDVLVFDTSTTPDLWVAKSIPTILGYTPANIASPTFTGNPTAPTPSYGDNDTSIATTAFVQAALNTPSLVKVNGNLTTAVNSTSLTTLYSFYVPANTVAAGDMIHVVGRARKTPVAANGNCSMRIYVNTSATAGGSIVGVITTAVANNVYMQLRREISVTNATSSSIVHLNTSSTGNDDTASNGASSVLAIDWTTDQYIVLGITPVSSADTWYGMGFRAEIKKYNP